MHDYLLIEPESADKQAGGLIRLDKKDKKISRAKVIAVGQDAKEYFKVGDQVIFQSWQTDESDLGDILYTFIRAEFILAKIK